MISRRAGTRLVIPLRPRPDTALLELARLEAGLFGRNQVCECRPDSTRGAGENVGHGCISGWGETEVFLTQ